MNTVVPAPTYTFSVVMTSGTRYRVEEVFLYEETQLRRAQALRLSAAGNLGGVSTGIGFWGSPEWALGGALALGILENVANNAAAKKGMSQMEECNQLMASAQRDGMFLSVRHIHSIATPQPGLWRGVVSRGSIKSSYAHSGEPFVLVRTSDNETVCLAWEKVEAFLPPLESKTGDIQTSTLVIPVPTIPVADRLVCPPGMPIFEWREALIKEYGIRMQGDNYVWNGTSYASFNSVVAAMKSEIADA